MTICLAGRARLCGEVACFEPNQLARLAFWRLRAWLLQFRPKKIFYPASGEEQNERPKLPAGEDFWLAGGREMAGGKGPMRERTKKVCNLDNNLPLCDKEQANLRVH